MAVQNVDPGCCTLYRSVPTVTPGLDAPALFAAPAKKPTGSTLEAAAVNVFPNPAKDVLTISAPSPINRIIVTGTEGKVYLEQTYQAALLQVQLSVTSLPAGVYFVQVFSDGKMTNKKVVIAR